MRTIANGPVMDVFAEFDLQKIALLLDVDGTIVDIGPSPTEVHERVRAVPREFSRLAREGHISSDYAA